MSLADGMRGSLNIEDVRAPLMTLLIMCSPPVLLIVAIILLIKSWRYRIGVMLLIVAIGIVVTF